MPEFIVIGGFTIACALADRLRGGGFTDKFPRAASKLLYAALSAMLVTRSSDGYFALIYVALFFAGASIGWGRPLGLALGGENDPDYEWWQRDILRRRSLNWLAVLCRGSMWLGPASFLTHFTGNVMYSVAAVAMPIAFFAAPYIAVQVAPTFNDRWAYMEYIRGGLFGSLLALGYLCLGSFPLVTLSLSY